MKKLTTIYTNGKSLFTLEDYGKKAGVCHANNITIHSEVSHRVGMAMHSTGKLHYIFGIGDTIELKDKYLNRSMKLNKFTIS